jgi:hypothetical protein
MNTDPYKFKIESFFRQNGDGDVNAKKLNGGYSIFYGSCNAPLARLRFSGDTEIVEVLWWSHRDKWESIGDFDGIFLPFDDALKYIDENHVGCFSRFL